MTELFKKLNFKAQEEIFILNSPDSFQEEISEMKNFTTIKSEVKEEDIIYFIMIFVTERVQIDAFISKIIHQYKDDTFVWMCYPKGTSKKYKCDFNRDKGWDILKENNFDTVRMVSIDQDWSALRFRKTEFIKVLNLKK